MTQKTTLLILLGALLLLASCAQKTEQYPPLVHADGSYDVVPLEKEVITLKVIQSSVEDIQSMETAQETIQRNLEKISGMIEQACTQGEKPDIILLHEFPLTGYIYGSRDEKLQMATRTPGPESEALGKLAEKYDTYIIYGSYAVDEEWPGHILSLTTVLGRDGQIVKKIWKPRNIKRFYSTFEITTTTVESVREKFRQKYGVEEELPVLRTEFGNIALSTAQLDPFIFAAFTMQGAEIILRTSTLFFESDVINTAMVNNVFSAMSNIPMDSPWGGKSMVVAPDGTIMSQLDRTSEDILTARIPIAAFRENRTLPQYSVELTRGIIDQYVEEIPTDHMDLPADELPQNGKKMKTLLDSVSRWLNK